MRIAIFNLHFRTLGGGERRSAALAQHLATAHEVTILSHESIDKFAIKNLFGIDLSEVEVIPLAGKDQAAEIRALRLDLFINNSHGSELACPAPKGIYMCMFPEEGIAPPTSYDCVTANSSFTAGWVRQRWGLNAEVVYSACIDMGPPAPKEKIILNVGRFFAPTAHNHHKRQDLLLETFRQIPKAHSEGWELHFVGNLGAQSDDPHFVDALQNAAHNLPVRFHFNLDLTRLRDLYRRASFYWHATGFGFADNLDPLKQEHFGMSIVEAMSAGVIPLAFNGGGPRETVASGVNGFLWNNPVELSASTCQLMRDNQLLKQMSKEAGLASRRFTQGEFQSRMDAIVTRLVTPQREVSISCAS